MNGGELPTCATLIRVESVRLRENPQVATSLKRFAIHPSVFLTSEISVRCDGDHRFNALSGQRWRPRELRVELVCSTSISHYGVKAGYRPFAERLAGSIKALLPEEKRIPCAYRRLS